LRPPIEIAVQRPVDDSDDPVVDHGIPLPVVEGFELDVGAALIPVVDGFGLNVGSAAVEGNGLGVGTTGAALTPPTPSSVEPSGIPIRPTDDEPDATGPAKEPPPAPSQAPDAVPAVPPPSNSKGEPDVPALDVPVPDVVPVLELATPKDASGIEPPMPPHVVTLLVVGDGGGFVGLTPRVGTSVAPRRRPVGGTAEPGPMPSGEVVPMAGVGLPVASTCAKTGLHPKNAASIAAVNAHRIVISIVRTQRSSWLGNAEPADRQPSIPNFLVRCMLDLAHFVAGLPRSVERSSLLPILEETSSTCHRCRRPVEDRQMACRHH